MVDKKRFFGWHGIISLAFLAIVVVSVTVIFLPPAKASAAAKLPPGKKCPTAKNAADGGVFTYAGPSGTWWYDGRKVPGFENLCYYEGPHRIYMDSDYCTGNVGGTKIIHVPAKTIGTGTDVCLASLVDSNYNNPDNPNYNNHLQEKLVFADDGSITMSGGQVDSVISLVSGEDENSFSGNGVSNRYRTENGTGRYCRIHVDLTLDGRQATVNISPSAADEEKSDCDEDYHTGYGTVQGNPPAQKCPTTKFIYATGHKSLGGNPPIIVEKGDCYAEKGGLDCPSPSVAVTTKSTDGSISAEPHPGATGDVEYCIARNYKAGDLAGEGQGDCDDKAPGTYYNKDSKKCLYPDSEDDCPAGYEFVQGSSTLKDPNKDPDPDKRNKCSKTNQDGCPVPIDGPGTTVLRWAVCPVVTGMNVLLIGCQSPPPPLRADATDKEVAASKDKQCSGGLQGIIRALLFVDENAIFNRGDKTGAAYYTSWGVFRTFGVGLVIIAGLVMIISEALGLDIVDAYTIRKLLPRLLIVAVAITLSWSLCEFMIRLFNNLGSWAASLITFPFEGVTKAEGGAGWGLGSVIGQYLGGGAALGAGAFSLYILGPWGALSLLGTAIVALLIGLAMLTFRQVIIVFCVLVSPLALASAILPNTKPLYDLWFHNFLRTLAMYPLVVAVLTIGMVMSWLFRAQQGVF